MSLPEPTTAELLAAYRKSGLSLLGYRFEQALAIRPIRVALACKVKSGYWVAMQHGVPAPIQPGLI